MRWTHSILSTTPPEFITLDQVKADLDITHANDDALLTDHIASAIDWVQTYTNRFLAPTTVRVMLDRVHPMLSLPFGPFQSLTSLSVGGSSVASRVVGGEALDLLPAVGANWPYAPQELGAVVATYVVGYPVGAVPPIFAQAVKMIVSIFYDKPDGRELEAQWKAVTNFLSSKRVRNI